MSLDSEYRYLLDLYEVSTGGNATYIGCTCRGSGVKSRGSQSVSAGNYDGFLHTLTSIEVGGIHCSIVEMLLREDENWPHSEKQEQHRSCSRYVVLR